MGHRMCTCTLVCVGPTHPTSDAFRRRPPGNEVVQQMQMTDPAAMRSGLPMLLQAARTWTVVPLAVAMLYRVSPSRSGRAAVAAAAASI
jgi:hypothetical protein